ncbi:energy transducer TonB [Gluconobacter wancherniae]|uniref:energy transducer TonB n=1 Tax=Gluconobacter wancherniae TaxID=1307955 RepID=UPI001B8C562E|nr:energy transducer TonB [Gluconobacter wancherniae]MBS1087625.1 energy transducer TonB [Gluconobacter wancherniae]MBS1093308.1 energy transducer TonB [Gluconobacter wancherniae]
MVRPRRSDKRRFRFALSASVCVHAALIGYLVARIPYEKPPEPPEPPAVEMEFEKAGPPTHPVKADKPADKPAPAPAPVKTDAPPAPTPPEKAPTEEPPPPPPPPQPVPPPPETHPEKLPPMKLPPKMTEPTPEPVPASPPKPSPPSKSTMVAPPMPQTAEKADKLPDTPTFSHITQPNAAKKTQADSHSLLATLDSFRADQKQSHAPKAHANPPQGGAPGGGGVPNGDITRGLSVSDQKAIGGSVRRCYTEDTEARNYATFVAHMIVTVDATGEARLVQFAPDTAAKMNSDPSYRVLAERARDAVLSPTCAHLPIPSNLLGQTHQLRFVFRP